MDNFELDHNNSCFNYSIRLCDCLVSHNFKGNELKFDETSALVVDGIDLVLIVCYLQFDCEN